jgi:alpha-L-rhamnosidase
VALLCPVLTQYGYADAAHRLLLNERFPSWGYSIRHGATPIWERWDGWTEEHGFQTQATFHTVRGPIQSAWRRVLAIRAFLRSEQPFDQVCLVVGERGVSPARVVSRALHRSCESDFAQSTARRFGRPAISRRVSSPAT